MKKTLEEWWKSGKGFTARISLEGGNLGVRSVIKVDVPEGGRDDGGYPLPWSDIPKEVYVITVSDDCLFAIGNSLVFFVTFWIEAKKRLSQIRGDFLLVDLIPGKEASSQPVLATLLPYALCKIKKDPRKIDKAPIDSYNFVF